MSQIICVFLIDGGFHPSCLTALELMAHRAADSAGFNGVGVLKINQGFHRTSLSQKKHKKNLRFRRSFRDLFALVLLKFGQLPVEAVDPSVSPDGTLLAGVEGVAVRAGVDLDLFQGGTGLEGASAARASHHTVVISGVDSFFHH